MNDFQIADRLSPWIDAIKQKKAVLFFGAGMSAIAGCSGLRGICERLQQIEVIKREGLNIDGNLRGFVSASKNILMLDNDGKSWKEEWEEIWDGIFRECLCPNLKHDYPKRYVPIIKKIRDQIRPFPSIITTNPDMCLENTASYLDDSKFEERHFYFDVRKLTRDMFRNNVGVFKIHGSRENTAKETWTLADDCIYDDSSFKDFLIHVFTDYFVLFLGYSFRDSRLLGVLSEVMNNRLSSMEESKQDVRHFALIPSDKEEEHGHIDPPAYKHAHGVEVISYGLQDDFEMIIKSWVDKSFKSVPKEWLINKNGESDV